MRSPSMSSSWVVVAGRVLILSLAAGAVVLGFVVSRSAPDEAQTARVTYVCPMHPQATSTTPDDCPICRMALEPVAVAPALATAPAAEPQTVTLAPRAKLGAFADVARIKKYQTSLEMRASAWAESADSGSALLFLDEAQLVVPNELATFFPSGRPIDGVVPGIAVRMSSEPARPWDRATTLVRFHVEGDRTLVAGQTGSLKLETRLRKDLVVKASAVLDSPDGPYVLVVTNDRRTLTKRPIVIGNVLYGYAALISGLRENESVASAHTFFLDAERRLHGGSL